jgi:hypothetical protein
MKPRGVKTAMTAVALEAQGPTRGFSHPATVSWERTHKAMDYAIATYDADQDGMLSGS